MELCRVTILSYRLAIYSICCGLLESKHYEIYRRAIDYSSLQFFIRLILRYTRVGVGWLYKIKDRAVKSEIVSKETSRPVLRSLINTRHARHIITLDCIEGLLHGRLNHG